MIRKQKFVYGCWLAAGWLHRGCIPLRRACILLHTGFIAAQRLYSAAEGLYSTSQGLHMAYLQHMLHVAGLAGRPKAKDTRPGGGNPRFPGPTSNWTAWLGGPRLRIHAQVVVTPGSQARPVTGQHDYSNWTTVLQGCKDNRPTEQCRLNMPRSRVPHPWGGLADITYHVYVFF